MSKAKKNPAGAFLKKHPKLANAIEKIFSKARLAGESDYTKVISACIPVVQRYLYDQAEKNEELRARLDSWTNAEWKDFTEKVCVA